MKYELVLYDVIKSFGIKLYRIRALKDFGNVKKGELGGYVEKEDNLSQSGNAWVFGNSYVSGNARVSGNALIYDKAWIYGNALVRDNSCVSGNARVTGNARVGGNTKVIENVIVCGEARIYDNAIVSGNAKVSGKAFITGNAVVKSIEDYTVFKNSWSSGRHFTYTKSNKMWAVGCFYGTGQELIEKAYKDGEKIGKCYEAYVKLVETLEDL